MMRIIDMNDYEYPPQLDRDCDYFRDRRDDEFAPVDGLCCECYRYDICKAAYDRDRQKNTEDP